MAVPCAVRITSHHTLLSSLLASSFAKFLSEFVLRIHLAQHLKGGDLGTISIFGDGSEEGPVKEANDNRTRPVEDDAIPAR